MTAPSFLAVALAYARAGLPVFPLQAGAKVPAISGGFYSATTNPETIKRLWRIGDRNIGIPTGMPSGLWVFDIDPPEGEANFRRLEAAHDPLPPTRMVRTPRGGRHLWFAYTGPVPSTVSTIAANLDVRGDGGYVAVVPSITADGTYTWLSDPEAPLAIAPQWLIDLARKKPTISQRAVAGITKNVPPQGCSGCDAYGRAALEREIAQLAATPAGQRNHRLNYAAFRLFQLVAGGELREADVIRHLVGACERNGLVGDDGRRSVEATIRSGAKAGAQYPRQRKGATW